MEDSNSLLQPWRLIPIDQYSRPAEPARVAVRRGLLGIMDQLRKPVSVQDDLPMQKDFTALPPFLLEKAAASPTWDGLLQAINEGLASWQADPAQTPAVQLIIGAPHSGLPEALTAWAKVHDWRLVEAPSVQQIRAGGQWLTQFMHNQDLPLVIPRLEHLYLRHQNSLTLVRQMLAWLANRQGHCLIGINSWSWEYLNRVLGIHALISQPSCPAACDAEHLKIWLHDLASGAEKFGFKFRQSNNGKFVLPPVEDPDVGLGTGLANYLNYLAAYSRGIPGVAWGIWRQSLQHEVDETVDDKAQATAEAGLFRTIWVKSWPQMQLPDLTGVLTQSQSFILHALLLHGGLPENALAMVLPLEPGEISTQVHRMHAAGLVEITDGRWQVTAPAYPAIRNALVMEGYLVDGF